MVTIAFPLGTVDFGQYTYLLDKVATSLWEFAPNPEFVRQSLERVGDLIVWNGEKGTHVVAAMDSLTESQGRIESAISGVETTQLTMASTLSTVQLLSMATLGVTSLTAGFMAWRLHALNHRLHTLTKQVADIKAHLDARDRALLDGSLSFLREFEKRERTSDLENALDKARTAASTYAKLTDHEIESQRRLPVIN